MCSSDLGSTPIIRAEVPPECSGVEIRELYPDGSLKRVIAAPLTEEEKKQKTQKEKEAEVCREKNQAQSQRNEALLDRYRHEEDLQEARYKALGDQLDQVNQASAMMKRIMDKGADLTERARFYEPPHQMPVDLKNDLDLNYQLEARQMQLIVGAASAIKRINETYDADLKLYRALVNHTAKMPCETDRR